MGRLGANVWLGRYVAAGRPALLGMLVAAARRGRKGVFVLLVSVFAPAPDMLSVVGAVNSFR